VIKEVLTKRKEEGTGGVWYLVKFACEEELRLELVKNLLSALCSIRVRSQS